MTTDILDFNHISPDLTIEQKLELKSYYENCHLKCFLYKKSLLTTGGVASVIATGGV